MSFRAGGIHVDVGLKLSNFETGAKSLAKSLKKLEKNFSDVGKSLTTTLTAPLAAIGAASFAAVKSYSSAFKEIERATGASGEALKGLGDSFENVFTKSNRGPADVALAISRIRLEVGATGPVLEKLSQTILNLSTITNSDLGRTIESTTGVLDNWSIANENATEKLNMLLGVSQVTGVEVNDLADKLKVGGPTLRAFGVGFEDAATMVGLLADKGLDVEKFFGALDKLPKKIKDTHDLGAAFDALVKSAGSKDNAALLDDVIKGFGAKGATQAVEALKLLQAEWKKASESIATSGADINKTMDKTAGIGDKLQNLKNIATDALVPIGDTILDALKPALESIKPQLEGLATWIKSISPETLQWAVRVAAVTAAIGPLLIGLSSVVAGARNLANALGSLAGVAALNPFVAGIAVAVGAIWYFRDDIAEAFHQAGLVVSSFVTAFSDQFPGITSVCKTVVTSVVDIFSGMKNKIVAIFTEMWSWVSEITSKVVDAIESVKKIANFRGTTSLAGAVSKEIFGFADKFQNAYDKNLKVDAQKDEMRKIVDFFQGAWTNIKNGSADAGKEVEKTGGAVKRLGDNAGDAGGKVDNFNSFLEGTDKDVKEAEKAAKAAAEALEGLGDQLAELKNQSALDSLSKGISKTLSLDEIDVGAFNSLKEKYVAATRDGTLAGLKEAIEKAGPGGLQKATEIADLKANEQRVKLEEDLAEKMLNAHKKAYEESVEFWRNAFENAITGETFNLADTLKQVAVGFGADLAASMSQGATEGSGLISQLMKGSKSPQDIGANLAKYLFGGGDGKSGLFSNVSFDSLDSFWNGTEFAPGGIWPEDMTVSTRGVSDGLESLATELFAGANSASAYASALMASLKSIPKLGKGTSSTIDGATEIGFSALGAYFGGPVGAQIGSVVGDKVGDWLGGQFEKSDPEYLARHEITGKLEELIAKVGSMQYFDTGGQMHSVSNIVMGESDKFNTPGWSSDVWSTYGEQATQAFVGVGNALTEMLGITEDVGAQVGAMLLEQFNGDSEALKALVQTAGLSYDQFVNFLIERGKEGQDTWLAIISEVNAGAEAFQEGLTGSGQYIQAFDNLLATAGRGQISLNQVRNLAVEGAEASITTLEQLRTMLTESGKYTQEQLDALFAGFQAAGITNLDEVRNATDLQLAQIVASMDAYFQDHGIQWSKATEEVKAYEDALNELSGKQIDVDINLRTHLDGATEDAIDQGLLDSSSVNADSTTTVTTGKMKVTKKMAFGGVLNGPTFLAPGTLAGEAGPEGVFPLKRMGNGELGVRGDVGKAGAVGGVTIYVDARGAEAGVEQRLNSMFADLEQRVVERSVSVIIDSAQRGGLRGFF